MSTSVIVVVIIFFFSSRRRHTRWPRDWSSDVCSSDLPFVGQPLEGASDEAFFHARRPLGFAVAILIALAGTAGAGLARAHFGNRSVRCCWSRLFSRGHARKPNGLRAPRARRGGVGKEKCATCVA